MKHKPIQLDNCVYLLPIPDLATDPPMRQYDEIILELATKLEKLTESNSDYTTCEECGSKDDVILTKVCNNCYAEEIISHIV